MLQVIVDFGTLSLFGLDIPLRLHGYGLMLVLGFLSAIWLAWWRCRRCGENPEAVVQCGLLALVGGVVGARAAYVIQHWDTQFAGRGLGGMLNITSGGLIYYGGLIFAAVLVIGYFLAKRVPVRRYVDIVAPSLMVGLAFGRMGCLLNGCCYGAQCSSDWALGATFPMYSRPLIKLDGRDNPFSENAAGPSPVYHHQWSRGLIEPDEHLVNHRLTWGSSAATGGRRPLLPPKDLHGALNGDQLDFLTREQAKVRKEFEVAAGADGLLTEAEWHAARQGGSGFPAAGEHWSEASAVEYSRDNRLGFEEYWAYVLWRRSWLVGRFDADADGKLSEQERRAANEFLQADQIALALNSYAHPVTPAQALGVINALLLAGLLAVFHRLRRREGQVFAVLLVTYPITRFVLEAIRDDNPHNLLRGVLTHNQYTSLAMLLSGIVLLIVLQKLPPSAGPAWARRRADQQAPGANRKQKTPGVSAQRS